MKLMKQFPFLVALCLIGLVGCDYYDLDDANPTDDVGADIAVTNLNSAGAARAGIYDAMQDADLTFDGFLSLWQYFSDECDWSGTFPTRAEFDIYNVTTSNGTMATVFSDFYDVINVANTLIGSLETVEDPSFTEGTRENLLGEARMARAFIYYHLVQGWGGVPLILTPTQGVGPELNVAKSNEDEIFNQIVADATYARDNLNGGSLGFNSASASALLARVALIRGRYDDAMANAFDAIGEDYDLTGVPYLEDEIFYLNFSATDGTSIAFFYAPSALGGRYSINPSADLVAAFDSTDLRFPQAIAFRGNQDYGNKYNDFASPSGAQTDPLYFFRAAEQVLIISEVAARNGDFDMAEEWINQVRTRAGLEDIDDMDADNFLDYILDERFKELCMEGGHRLWDLRRTGRALEVLGPGGYDACDDVWPLPQRDIDRNTNLEQNGCCNC